MAVVTSDLCSVCFPCANELIAEVEAGTKLFYCHLRFKQEIFCS